MSRSQGKQQQTIDLPDKSYICEELLDHPDAHGAIKGGGGSSGPVMLNMQAFTTSGTFTVPSGIANVVVEIVGGGGGGGAGNGAGQVGSTGAGGGYGIASLAVIPGQVITVTIGAGGAAGTSNGNGAAGGTTSFLTASATGGPGGTGGVVAANIEDYATSNSGVGGGTATGCALSVQGTQTDSTQYGRAFKYSMTTASTFKRAQFTSNVPTISSLGFGSGGFGANTDSAQTIGWAGTGGLCIVRWGG